MYPSRLPTSFHSSCRNAQHIGGFVLLKSLIEKQVDDFTFIFGKAIYPLMKLTPFGQILRLFSDCVNTSARFIGCLLVSMVLLSDAFGSEMMPGQINQLSPNVDCCQIEKMPDGLKLHFVERPMQPENRVLKNIIRLFPPAKTRVVAQHLSCESQKTLASMVEQSLL